ncbi:MAG TPA: hypothetical protein VIL36_11950 [Acidimicrobiales bacterium]
MGNLAGSRRGAVVALAAGALVVGLIVTVAVLTSSDDAGSGEPGDGASPPSTAPDGGPTTGVPLPPPGPLPGLTAVAVTEAMSREGWTCFQDEQERPDYVSTSCMEPGNLAQLSMLSTPAGEPVYLETTVYDDDNVAHLQRVASLGWTGVDVEEASDWIEEMIASGDLPPFRTRYGDVVLELQGMPGAHTAWYLSIGRKPTD